MSDETNPVPPSSPTTTTSPSVTVKVEGVGTVTPKE